MSHHGSKFSENTDSNSKKIKLYAFFGLIAGFALISAAVLFMTQSNHDFIHIDNPNMHSKKSIIRKRSSSNQNVETAKDPVDKWISDTHNYFQTKRDYYKRILEQSNSETVLKEIKISSLSTHTHEQPAASISTSNKHTRLHAVTYASHSGRDDRFCRAIESAIRNKINVVILGWNTPWKGLSQKLEAAKAYAKDKPSTDIILFTDAFDILYTQSSAFILSQFLQFNSSIIFSAECGCWPHVAEDPDICLTKYPVSPTPYRYLNSGTWIGYASSVSEMLEAVIVEAGQDFTNANDQKLIADLYIAGRFGVQLDFYNKIFQSMHLTLDPPLARCNPSEDLVDPKESKGGSHSTWLNKRTNSMPAVFHFNGGGKRYHLDMESKMWYKKSSYNTKREIEELRNYLVSTPNSDPSHRIRFDELCPGYINNEYKQYI